MEVVFLCQYVMSTDRMTCYFFLGKVFFSLSWMSFWLNEALSLEPGVGLVCLTLITVGVANFLGIGSPCRGFPFDPVIPYFGILLFDYGPGYFEGYFF